MGDPILYMVIIRDAIDDICPSIVLKGLVYIVRAGLG